MEDENWVKTPNDQWIIIDDDGYFFHVPGRFFGCTLDRHSDLTKAVEVLKAKGFIVDEKKDKDDV